MSSSTDLRCAWYRQRAESHGEIALSWMNVAVTKPSVRWMEDHAKEEAREDAHYAALVIAIEEKEQEEEDHSRVDRL